MQDNDMDSSTIPARLRYDPSQGAGTDAWQLSVAASKALNKELRMRGQL